MNIRRGPGPSSVGDLIDIAFEDRREIGVDDGRIAAPDKLDQRGDLVADRNLREADIAGDVGGDALVFGIFPRMHEDNGE